MMKAIRHTLITDGRTDANLIPIIDWCLKQAGDVAQGTRAEFWRLQKPPDGLAGRIAKAIELFPCDILFVHRDAEGDALAARVSEVREAFETVQQKGIKFPAVAVVPVRMLEAWLCFDERAIRNAAGNPNGTTSLDLPPLNRIESRPDPKEDLNRALREASELSGRRLKKFKTATAFWRITDNIEDFSPLRKLPAFRAFEESLRQLKAGGWQPGFYGSTG